MELLIALLASGGLLLVTLILPILSFVRAQAAQRQVAEVRQRLASLEAAVATLASAPAVARDPDAPPPAVPTPAPASAPAVREPVVAPAPIASPRPAPSLELPPPPPPRPAAPAGTGDLEQQIGSRWLLYAGIVAVVLGMSYFVKYAFDNGWISEPLRVMGGAAIGIALVAAGMRFWSRGLAPFGQALAGGGIVVLYVSVYAALHFYGLIGPTPAFGLMVLVTAAATWLADRQRSQPLAVVALVGGFATPLLVGGGRGAQVVLFTYIAILIGGSAALARRHAWPLLSAGSYICTFALLVAWFFDSYEAAHWLRTELFLTLYASLFAYLLWALLSSKPSTPAAQLAIAALVTAPLAYHVASIVLLNRHPAAWLLYVVLITLAGLVVSQRTRTPWLRVLVLLLVGLPALAWLTDLDYPRWYAAALTTAVVMYALHLASQWEATDADGFDRSLPLMESVHTQANGLLLPFSLYLFLETRAAEWGPWVVGGLSAWNAALAAYARGRAPRMTLQFTAVSATLAAAAIVLAFDGPAVAAGWAAEGALVGWLALRERSRWLGFGSALLVILGSLQVVQVLTTPLPLGDTPVANPRVLAAALVIALFAWLAGRMRAAAAADAPQGTRTAVIILANLLAVLLLSSEIHAYFDQQAVDPGTGRLAMTPGDAGLAEQLTLSVSWALYAVALIAVGIRRAYVPARYLGIGLFGVTVAKVLANDIAGLDRFYRMLTVLGVGVLLLVASYLYQRRTVDAPRDEVDPAP